MRKKNNRLTKNLIEMDKDLKDLGLIDDGTYKGLAVILNGLNFLFVKFCC